MKRIKYFKIFESYQELENGSPDLVQENDNLRDFSKSEIDFIRNTLKDTTIKDTESDKPSDIWFLVSVNRPERKMINPSSGKGYVPIDIYGISILKLNDEWFIVTINKPSANHCVYKCDQITGVEDCIKKELNLV